MQFLCLFLLVVCHSGTLFPLLWFKLGRNLNNSTAWWMDRQENCTYHKVKLHWMSPKYVKSKIKASVRRKLCRWQGCVFKYKSIIGNQVFLNDRYPTISPWPYRCHQQSSIKLVQVVQKGITTGDQLKFQVVLYPLLHKEGKVRV